MPRVKIKREPRVYFHVETLYYRFMECIHKEKVIVSINPSCKHNFINVSWLIDCKFLQSIFKAHKVDGENVQIFKDLKITMDKYVLHSYFYAIDMDDVDIVLGYPWMDSVGTININVQKKFLKFWYKKNKITLQDVSLSKKEGPIEAIKVVITEFEVEYEAESTERHEEKPQEDTIKKPRRSLTQRNTMLQS
jgi:hypothetical protein